MRSSSSFPPSTAQATSEEATLTALMLHIHTELLCVWVRTYVCIVQRSGETRQMHRLKGQDSGQDIIS